MANKKDVAVFQDIFTNNRLGWNTGLPFPKNRYPLGMDSTQLMIYSPDLYAMYRTEGDDRDNFPDYDNAVQYGILASQMVMPDYYPFLGDLEPNPYGVFPEHKSKKKLNLQEVKAKESDYNGQAYMAMDFSPTTRKVMMSGVGNFEDVFTELNYVERTMPNEVFSTPIKSNKPPVKGKTPSRGGAISGASAGCPQGTTSSAPSGSGESARCVSRPSVLPIYDLKPIDNTISQIISSTTTLSACSQKCQQAFPVNSPNWTANRKRCIEKCYATKPVTVTQPSDVSTGTTDQTGTTTPTPTTPPEEIIPGGNLPPVSGGGSMGGGGGSAPSEETQAEKKAGETPQEEIAKTKGKTDYMPMIFLGILGLAIGYYVAKKYSKNINTYSVIGFVTGALIGYVYANGLDFGGSTTPTETAKETTKESSFCAPCMAAMI